jgi:hypothetical protein
MNKHYIYIIMFLLLVFNVFAVTNYNVMPLNATTSGVTNEDRGERFVTNTPCITGLCTFVSVNKTVNCTAPKVYLRTSPTGVNLSSASFVGNVATFNYPLNSSTAYWVMASNDSNNYDGAYASPATYNYTGVDVNWTNNYYVGGVKTDLVICFKSITTSTTNGLDIVFVSPPTPSNNVSFLFNGSNSVNITVNETLPNSNSSISLFNFSNVLVYYSNSTQSSNNLSSLFVSSLDVGTYIFNASSSNGSSKINSSTLNFTIYNFTRAISNFSSTLNVSPIVNFSWFNASTFPLNTVSLDNYLLYLFNGVSTVLVYNGSNNFVNANLYLFNLSQGYSNYFILNSSLVNGVSNVSLIPFNVSLPINLNLTLINFSFNKGFNKSNSVLINFSCSNAFGPNVTFLSSFNNYTIFNASASNNTIYGNSSLVLNDSFNMLSVNCSDSLGSVKSTLSTSVFFKSLCLINEQTNALFNPLNLSSALVYYDDNSSYFDFKAGIVSCVNFSDNVNSKLRFSLGYLGGQIITRYVDVSLVNSYNVRVCANTDPSNFYEQLIISASLSPIVMSNVFSNCLVAADYTRFAYQDGLVLKAYTTNSMYSFYNFVNGVQTIVASIDGSIATYINLDTLVFSQNSQDITLASDSLSFSVFDNDTTNIYYLNLANDNLNVSVNIIRLDTGASVFSSSNFVNPNEFTLLFNHNIVGVNDSTVFSVVVSMTKSDGRFSFIKRYFNINGKSGTIPSNFAMFISILIFLFGLTFASQRITFSWFGIIICLAAIVVLAVSLSTWYGLLIMFIEFVALIFIILMMVYSSSGSRTLES